MSNGDGRGREKAKLFLQVGSDGPACVMLQSPPSQTHSNIPGVSSSILRINTAKLGLPFVLLENEA